MELDSHKFIGLGRDKHPINQDSKLLWDARNIRVTNRDDDTLLSITNEKGTLDTKIAFDGDYVGHCALGDYIVVFTSNKEDLTSYIYRLEYREGKLCKVILYNGVGLLDPKFPIDSLGFYETDLLQKIYWVDGKNLPRVINIKELELKQLKYIENKDYTADLNYTLNSFDFCPVLNLQEEIKVTKIFGQGVFSPGTIQYAFSYYKKYGLESKIFYITPIYYISHETRAGAPDAVIANTFKIEISGLDDFDYIRVYSIHKTSLNAVPSVKVVTDLELRDPNGNLFDKVDIVDTGTTGYNIDSTLLIYIGGEALIAGTISLKDGTMFLGSINTIPNKNKEAETIILENFNNHLFSSTGVYMQYPVMEDSTYYCYDISLNDKYSAGFKAFETYRCGIQMQFNNGEWSLPIHIGDKIINDQYLWESYPLRKEGIFEIDTSNDLVKRLLDIGVRKLRACVVFPSSYDRDVICQGVLSPTVFNVGDRSINTPYAQASWFFRPAFKDNDNNLNILNGASILFRHNKSLFTGNDRGAEVQNSSTNIKSLNDIIAQENAKIARSSFFVDENIVTLHSPDVEFDTALSELSYADTKLRIVGIASLSSIAGDIDIYASAAAGDSGGFNKKYLGYTIGENNKVNGGLVSGLFYEDAIIKEDYTIEGNINYLVYPWHRNGSLNNDLNRPTEKGTRTAVLETKVISNLKFFGNNLGINKVINYNITPPKVFNSDNISVLNIDHFGNTANYYGNVDTIILTGDSGPYNIYRSSSFSGDIGTLSENDQIGSSKESVRMKYITSPHLVFSLKGSSTILPILPIHLDLDNQDGNRLIIPDWDPFTKGGSSYQLMDTLFIYAKGGLANFKPSNRIGMYGIGGYNPNDNTGYLSLLLEYSAGNYWAGVTGASYAEDYILLQYTSIDYIGQRWDTDIVILGTTDDDYIALGDGRESRRLYNGNTIYYKCTFLNKGVDNKIKIELYNPEDAPVSKDDIYIKLETFKTDSNLQCPYLLIGELYRDNVLNKFGGNSKEAIQNNVWLPAGEIVDIRDFLDKEYVKVPFLYGDTWYQRYDCLKTQPYTKKDLNLIVEIGSFLCETRVNIDGRYDKNRGLLSNLNTTKENFNLINTAYTLKNDIFVYRILDEDFYKQHVFGTLIVWSLKKLMGGEVDLWTSISLASSLDLDGKYGLISKLQMHNNILLAFQDRCLSVINFNEKNQIPVSEGAPIEISNNYKVTGYQILQENLGCTDKCSIVSTTDGIYFVDSTSATLWKFDGKLYNISDTSFLKQWFKNLDLHVLWASLYGNSNGVKLMYDSLYNDTYIVPGPIYHDELDALCYSNIMLTFTSYLSYGGVLAMFNLLSKTFSIKENKEGVLLLWLNFEGDYNRFFGLYKPFSISFISNDKPEVSKIFDTIEYRADMYDGSSSTPLPLETFNYIRVENEYLDTTIRKNTDEVNKWNPKKKFRTWRGLIPRDAKPEAIRVRSRICNPWSKITLGYDKENYNKMVFHDVIVKYTV